jgi:polyphosphate:AMP phosphotransferase
VLKTAEIGNRIAKAEYDGQVGPLRTALLNAQFDLRDADFPVVIMVSGDDRLGAREVANLLNEWLDARFVDTHLFPPPTEEELERPRFWRYWRRLPPRGQSAVFVGGTTQFAIDDAARGSIDEAEFDRRANRILYWERALVDDGALFLKFWLHLPKNEHRRRLAEAKKHPHVYWRVNERDWRIYEQYDAAVPFAERWLRRTSSHWAPWNVIESTDWRYRNLAIGRAVAAAITARLAVETSGAERPLGEGRFIPPRLEMAGSALGAVDLSATLDKARYEKGLDKLQARLHGLAATARERKVTSVLVFEGWHAAGKGGVIRRITQALDAGEYQVVRIAAPTEEERAYHYLWRFWRHLPRAGRMLIFDRSWYGRVLVERVEGFASTEEWTRSFAEINEFEEQLIEHGMVLVKFWLQIDEDEQLRRFAERENTDYKRWKITTEDYRNRQRWGDYLEAVDEMVFRTSSVGSPWNLVPANDKRFARIEVLKTVCRALQDALEV